LELRGPKKESGAEAPLQGDGKLLLRRPFLAVKPQRRANPHEREDQQDVIAYADHQQQEDWVARNQIGPTWQRWRLTVEMPETANYRLPVLRALSSGVPLGLQSEYCGPTPRVFNGHLAPIGMHRDLP
jgi:hypothetical protein